MTRQTSLMRDIPATSAVYYSEAFTHPIMPIFDFVCKACDNQFEALVRGAAIPACPNCSSTELERQLSMPYAHTEGTHNNALKAAKRRDAKQSYEQVNTQREYEASHDDDGH